MTDSQFSIDIRVPDDREAGAYANLLSVWYTAFEFTLDFAVSLPQTERTMPARVVARVKVPPTLVFDIIRTINASLTQYESRFGVIRRPGDGEPLPFPENLEGGDDAQTGVQ